MVAVYMMVVLFVLSMMVFVYCCLCCYIQEIFVISKIPRLFGTFARLVLVSVG